MEQDLAGLAFTAGLVAALNPCGFAMLPAYLALVVRNDARTPRALLRALAATAAMTTGFVAVFGAFGALTVAVASSVQRYMPYVTAVIGIVLVGLGIWLLCGRRLALTLPGARWAPTARLGSMLGYGVGFALASLSCTAGPFLAVTAAATHTSSPSGTVLIYLAYAGGFALIVGALAVATAFASAAVADRLRRILPYANRIGGALLVAVGLYVTYYGIYEVRLFAGGATSDPVIAVAGRVQGTLAGWVHQHGAWPWLLVLVAVVVLVSAAEIMRRAIRSRRHTRSSFRQGPIRPNHPVAPADGRCVPAPPRPRPGPADR